MIKIINILLFLLIYISPVFSQVKVLQGSTDGDDDNAYCIAKDAAGNLLIGGTFHATVDFDPSVSTANLVTGQASGNSNENGFLAKYTSTGVYIWAIKIGNSTSASQTIVNNVTLDGSNNAYIVGQFQGTVDFDPGAGTSNLTSAGGNDIFIAKYNSSGAYQWAYQIGAASSDKGLAIAIDASSNIYITGDFQGTCDFDPSGSTANLVASGVDGFVASYSSTGTYRWAFALSGTSSEDVYGIVVDSGSSNIYVCGSFQKVVDFDPSGSTNSLSSNVSTSGIDIDGFVAKYTCAAGAYVWAKKIGGSTAAATNSEQVINITLDASDNVYITGQMITAAIDVNGVTLTKIGTVDSFYAKLNTSGTTQWAKNIGTASNSINSNDIYVQGTDLILCGYFTATIDFDPSVGTQNGISAGSTDIFIAEYSTSDGSFICKTTMGGVSIDQAKSIVSNGNVSGTFYAVGWYRGASIDLDPSSVTNSFTSGATGTSSDAFLGKYSSSCGSTVLPITLSSFTAICNQNQVDIEWSTLSELNNDYFTLEKSSDGENWQQIQIINGAGNSNSISSYSFIDYTPFSNLYYFKLSQTDFDGLKTTLSVISVECETTKPITIFANPNPSSHDVNIILSGREDEFKTIYFTDISGQTVIELNLQMNLIVTVNIENLSAGIYFISTHSKESKPLKFNKIN